MKRKVTHRQPGLRFAEDRIYAAVLGRHFQSADHLPLGFGRQPMLAPLEAGIQVPMQTYLAEVARMEQELEKNVHITRSSLIFQSDKASFFLGVVAVKASD